MAFNQETIDRVRALKRNARLVVFRTTTPANGEDFFVQRLGGPGGETNGIVITDLRMKFSVERDLKKHPNKCEIEIYNLAPTTRAALETEPLEVEFSAGHDGVNRLLFKGDLLHARSKQEGPNWVTRLQVSDGLRAFARARVNKSYRSGTPVKTILRDVARTMGQTLPREVEASTVLDAQIASGTVMSGASRDELERLLAPYGYDFSFQNGRLQVLRDEDSRNDTWPINESVGMIGTPEYGHARRKGKPPSMDVTSLLYPELLPGGKVEITSLAAKGLFKLVKVKSHGDTHGDEWFTEAEVKPVNNATPARRPLRSGPLGGTRTLLGGV